jgi:hypothetical protein
MAGWYLWGKEKVNGGRQRLRLDKVAPGGRALMPGTMHGVGERRRGSSLSGGVVVDKIGQNGVISTLSTNEFFHDK